MANARSLAYEAVEPTALRVQCDVFPETCLHQDPPEHEVSISGLQTVRPTRIRAFSVKQEDLLFFFSFTPRSGSVAL